MAKRIRRKVIEYPAVFEPDEERGGYTVYIPSLPGCISEGDSFEEALKNIREAANLYLEVMLERREKPETSDKGVFIAPVRVTV